MKQIAKLNDELRQKLPILPLPHRLVLTAGVAALPAEQLERIFSVLKKFNQFDTGNDPHMEHDFIGVDVDGERIFMKIDYYDRDLKFFSQEEGNSVRVFTILYGHEY